MAVKSFAQLSKHSFRATPCYNWHDARSNAQRRREQQADFLGLEERCGGSLEAAIARAREVCTAMRRAATLTENEWRALTCEWDMLCSYLPYETWVAISQECRGAK